jgi:hypothetical protein
MGSSEFSFSLSEIGQRLGLRRSGRFWRGRCPICGTDALALTANGSKLLVYCFAGCTGKDLLTEFRKHDLISAEVCERVFKPRVPDAPPKAWSAEAERIWSRGAPFHNTLLETYFAARDCLFPPSGDIRFLPAGAYGPFPCMMARVTDAITAKPLTLHFTRLAADGSGKAQCERPKRLLAGHRKSGGVIRLTEDAEVTQALGLAEGIETALSVMKDGWMPVWATVDSGNMAAFPVIAGIESLTLFADNDASGTGRKAAEECVARWRAAGRQSRIVMPKLAGTDWNDDLACISLNDDAAGIRGAA